MERILVDSAFKAIFLGKKSCICCIYDEAGKKAFHIRLKGIPSRCIQHKVNECYGGDPYALYSYMLKGKEVSFDLTSGGNCVFKTQKDHSVWSSELIRKVKF